MAGERLAVTTTPEHPFYVQAQADTQPRPKPVGHEELNSHWVGAGHLQIGDRIKQADGSVGTVANVVTVQQTLQMFNLTVETAHTFYVGENRWLVHNTDACDPWLMKATDRGKYIKDALANGQYSDANGWFRVGSLNNGFFPLVDFQNGRTLVSLKSVDTRGSTWLARMEEHIEDLGTRGAAVNGQIARMVLDVRVQSGGAAAARQLVQYRRRFGVTVIVKEFK